MVPSVCGICWMVSIFLWRTAENWCICFLKNSWYLAMEARGRPIYHHNSASLKVPNNNLQFRESDALMMVICVLVEVTCSYESSTHQTWPKREVWIPQGYVSSHISSESGWGSNTSTSSRELDSWWCYLILWTLPSSVWLWQCNSSMEGPISSKASVAVHSWPSSFG